MIGIAGTAKYSRNDRPKSSCGAQRTIFTTDSNASKSHVGSFCAPKTTSPSLPRCCPSNFNVFNASTLNLTKCVVAVTSAHASRGKTLANTSQRFGSPSSMHLFNLSRKDRDTDAASKRLLSSSCIDSASEKYKSIPEPPRAAEEAKLMIDGVEVLGGGVTGRAANEVSTVTDKSKEAESSTLPPCISIVCCEEESLDIRIEDCSDVALDCSSANKRSTTFKISFAKVSSRASNALAASRSKCGRALSSNIAILFSFNSQAACKSARTSALSFNFRTNATSSLETHNSLRKSDALLLLLLVVSNAVGFILAAREIVGTRATSADRPPLKRKQEVDS
mmetsp:Transcript_6236/g.19573  ORF Transcript_6236/g.19573 Transcript_6236/m.19573 type:complete len:336 (-) Transcript_6236:14467-15474(-)